MADLIDRQAAIDAAREELESGTYFDIPSKIEALPAVQPDHTADVSKKVERTDETAQNVSDSDLISRKAVSDALTKFVSYAICDESTESYVNGLIDAYNLICQLPSVQTDRAIIDDCLYHIYKNISVHTATGGVIAIRYYMEKLYEEIYGEGERPWWMT